MPPLSLSIPTVGHFSLPGLAEPYISFSQFQVALYLIISIKLPPSYFGNAQSLFLTNAKLSFFFFKCFYDTTLVVVLYIFEHTFLSFSVLALNDNPEKEMCMRLSWKHLIVLYVINRVFSNILRLPVGKHVS